MSILVVPRVCINTILGSHLNKSDLATIKNKIQFLEDEIIEIIYSRENILEKINLHIDVIVIITNYRLIKLEKNDEPWHKNRKDIIISTVNHKKGHMFKWDKIEFKFKNGESHDCGIYHGDSCSYFCNYLRTKPCMDFDEVMKAKKLAKEKEDLKNKELVSKMDNSLAQVNKSLDDLKLSGLRSHEEVMNTARNLNSKMDSVHVDLKSGHEILKSEQDKASDNLKSVKNMVKATLDDVSEANKNILSLTEYQMSVTSAAK